jgi:hypothetical protein
MYARYIPSELNEIAMFAELVEPDYPAVAAELLQLLMDHHVCRTSGSAAHDIPSSNRCRVRRRDG